MTQITVRAATAHDIPRLAALRHEFRRTLGEPNESASEFCARCEHWMRARLNNGQWYCWVGERGGIIVGNVWASLIEKMPNPLVEPEEHVYITNFFVTDEARGAGNGTRILAAALAWCAERGIHGAILWPTARGRPLYERLGFSAKGEVMQKLFAPIQH